MAEAKKPIKKTKAEEKAQLEAIIDTEKAVVEQEAVEIAAEPVKETAKAGKRSAKAIKETEEKEAKQERKAGKADVKTEDAKKEAKKPARSRLERAGKKYKDIAKLVDQSKTYSLGDALELATKTNPAKFDATVELHINLGVDPKQADHNIRGTVVLPAGTGKDVKVAVANDELLAQLDKGVIDFNILVADPAFMPKLGKYAKLLGPKGLMPNPKSGTVSKDTDQAVKEAKAGRVEYRVDQAGIIHVGVGKVSFGKEKLEQNSGAILNAVRAAKPASLKSNYINSVYVTTSMGPSIKVTL